MKKIPAILFCTLAFHFFSFSQPVIKGRVVSAANGEPIAGSSVFISNTTAGTSSAKDGSFELTNVPAGKHELVISCVGYETNVFSFSTAQLPMKLKVEMTVKVRELKNVTVEPSVEEGWDKWGRMFTDNFIGRTPNAGRCRIKNEKALRFRYYKKSNRVVAYSDEPLILENKALGYRIRYQLEDFEVNFKAGTTYFAGYPLFEELDKNSKSALNRWSRHRDKAYYGSMMHFMYCLYHDSLAQHGFEVRRMVRLPNLEKQRVKNIYRAIRVVQPQGTGISVRNADSLPQPSKDSMDYYERLLGQEDFKTVIGSHLLTRDSLLVGEDGEYKLISFTDYLYVTYKKEQEDLEYLVYSREKRSRFFQRSNIQLNSDEPLIIDKNGNYYPPQNIFSSAYWGWSEKIADLLPVDYKPSK